MLHQDRKIDEYETITRRVINDDKNSVTFFVSSNVQQNRIVSKVVESQPVLRYTLTTPTTSDQETTCCQCTIL